MSKIIKNSSGISLRFMMATLLLAGVIVKPQNVLAVSGLAANVDPFLGTGSKINPGAILPFGMIIAGPKTTKKDAGYNFRTSGSVKYFLHYNLQGSTLGSPLYVSILPTTGGVGSDAAGTFQHATEVATPGYYKVHLDNFNIDCETTVTQRAALHQYTFVAASSDVRIFVGCNGGTATQVNPTELRGEEGGISYYMIFNKAFNSFNSTDKYATYNVTAGEQIKVKIGMSYTDTTKAKLNMDNELTTWDFNKVKGNAETTWNNYFGKITVAGDETFKKLFYTSMYFGATGIRTISDSDGTYKVRGGGDVKRASGWTKYTGFSLWDNYRATFPLINLISPTEGGDMAHSMIQDYVDAGKTCNWPYANVWKDCMQGSNDDSVIANAYINKGQSRLEWVNISNMDNSQVISF